MAQGLGIGQTLDETWERLTTEFHPAEVADPQLFQVIVLLVVGFVGGRILSEVVSRLLSMTALDEMAVKSDLQSVLRTLNYRGKLSDFIADTMRWLIYVLTVLAVFNLFGTEIIRQYSGLAMSYASTVIFATFIIIVGTLISDRISNIVIQLYRTGKISRRVDESHAEIPLYQIIGRIVLYIGYILTVIITFQYIGLNSVIIHILVAVLSIGLVAAFVLATRRLFRNIMISMYFQASRMFRGGERMRIGEYEGTIENIRPLYTKITGEDGTYFIPNTKLISEVVEYEGE